MRIEITEQMLRDALLAWERESSGLSLAYFDLLPLGVEQVATNTARQLFALLSPGQQARGADPTEAAPELIPTAEAEESDFGAFEDAERTINAQRGAPR